MSRSTLSRHRVRQHRTRTFSVELLLLALVAASHLGCDTNATIHTNPVFFNQVKVISAYPAVKSASSGEWERACGTQDATGYLLNVAFTTTNREGIGGSSGSIDKDSSVQPGDVVNDTFRIVPGNTTADSEIVLSQNTLKLDVDCYDPVPVNALDQPPDDNTCDGAEGSPDVSEVRHRAFVPYNPDEEVLRLVAAERGHNVIFVVDFSGSTKGLVNQDTNKEAKELSGQITNLQSIASDYNNQRVAAVIRFIRNLNDKDQFGVIAFGEGLTGGLRVPCSASPDDVQTDLKECFGTNKKIWEEPLQELKVNAGRANLWEAVLEAHAFLVNGDNGHSPLKRSNHVVVVTDGPDTAARTEALDDCQSSYSNTTHTDVLEAVEEETQKASAGQDHVDVHVHFVQFESPGYPGRDPRQMEVACVTEGQYQYINSEQMSKQGSVLQEALEVALDGVRYSLSGIWQLAVEDAALTSGDSAVGQLYALDGDLTVTAQARLYELKVCKDGKQEAAGGACESTTDCTVSDATCRSSDGQCVICTEYEYKAKEKLNLFGIGKGEEIFTAHAWDRRPVIRKPCTTSGSCKVGDGTETECHLYCSPELLVCPAGAEGYDLREGEACTAGKCCDGTCTDTGICPSCDSDD